MQPSAWPGAPLGSRVSGASRLLGRHCALNPPFAPLKSPQPDFNKKCTLCIKELLPHNSIGLQPYYYIKNAQKQHILRFSLSSRAACNGKRYIKLCVFMYLLKIWQFFD